MTLPTTTTTDDKRIDKRIDKVRKKPPPLSTSVSFVIGAHSGFTRKLYNTATAAAASGSAASDTNVAATNQGEDYIVSVSMMHLHACSIA